ncbi:MAG TPA: Uma2 family endonuclease [Thermomicrobiales bacterium]|nr:Uma2 family endonuclease [Thermomicrobiales bacterium]
MTISTSVTASEFEQMPRDGHHDELIRGVLKRMPPTSSIHGLARRNLAFDLDLFLEEHGLGATVSEVGLLLETDPDTVLGPDIAVMPVEYLPLSDEGGFERRIPLLVVEVLSPSNRRGEINTKVEIYLRAGVRLVLVVDPKQRTVQARTSDGEIQLLTEADELTGGEVLPGFRTPVARIFRWLT